MRANRSFLVVMLLCCAACKRQQGAGPSERPAAALDDGWTTFENAYVRLAVPPGQTVKTAQSEADRTPTFVTFKGGEHAGTIVYRRYEPRSDLPPRDAAELELKDYVSDGGRMLESVHAIPMKTGRCAAFAAVSDGVGCQAVFQGACSQHYFLAYCDGSDKKRYLFIGDLGATDSVDRRPPGFAENAAAFERVLRSIEFKAAKS